MSRNEYLAAARREDAEAKRLKAIMVDLRRGVDPDDVFATAIMDDPCSSYSHAAADLRMAEDAAARYRREAERLS